MTDGRRARILLITRNLPPLVGGMERLNWHIIDELSRRADVHVIGPAGSAARAPPNVKVVEVPLRPVSMFLTRAVLWALREARAWRPDMILAGSGLTAPLALLAARMSGASAAVYVHGLDIAVPHPAYRALWIPALRRMDQVVANSHATAALAVAAGFDVGRVAIVHPGVQLPDAQRNEEEVARFRAQHDLGDRPLLLSVGRLTARKGLEEFVVNSLPRIAAARPDVVLLIVGGEPTEALHARAQSPDRIRAAAARLGVADKLRFLGTITDFRQLGVVYQAADVHVFPVRNIPGDPEGFGMVAVEAAAHGLPTVAFASGGVVDAVCEGKSGWLVPPGDYDAFARAVVGALARGNSLNAACLAFGQAFAWPKFGEKLADALGLPASNLHTG